MDTIEAAVAEFKENLLMPYCLRECPGVCCNFKRDLGPGKQYALTDIKEPEINAIVEAGLEESVGYRIRVGLAAKFGSDFGKFCDKEVDKAKDKLMDKGNLSETNSSRYLRRREKEFNLQGIKCPAYDKKTHVCRIHDEEIRPTACYRFPIHFYDTIGVEMNELCPYIESNRNGVIDFIRNRAGDELAKRERHFSIFTKDQQLLILPEEAHKKAMEEKALVAQLLQALGATAFNR